MAGKSAPRNSNKVTAVARIYRDNSSKVEEYLVKILYQDAFAWLTYDELEEKLQDEVTLKTKNIRDAFGKRKARGLVVDIVLDKKPEISLLADGRKVCDMDDIQIADWSIKK